MRRTGMFEQALASVALALVLVISPANAQSTQPAQARAKSPESVIVGVKHVGVPVRDQDRALAFYTRALGFEVAFDEAMGPEARWIELAIPSAPTRVLLLAGPDVENRAGGFTNIVFLSHDVAASYKTMRARGVEFDTPPTPLPGGGMNAVFRDPDGNTFALATPDSTDTIPSGEWSGTLQEPDGRAFTFPADILDDASGATITFVIQGVRFPMADVRASNAGIRFTWVVDKGPRVTCVLERRSGGAFQGDCVDQEEGDSKRLTLRPPRP